MQKSTTAIGAAAQRQALVDFSGQLEKKWWRLSPVGMGSHLGWFEEMRVRGETRCLLDIEREGTMQLRHIRPGSLEWQDAQTDEGVRLSERLTPEEIEHLRKLSEDRSMRAREKKARTEVQ